MGACTSATSTETNPVTGETRTKTRLGGAHPGLRRQQQQQQPTHLFPSPSAKSAARYVSCGGGNALRLVEGPSSSPLVKVTLPNNVFDGQTIHVRAPDGRINEVIVPPGCGPGSVFFVEFAPMEELSQGQKMEHYASNTPPKSQTPLVAASAETRPDDGFATGFNNSNWTTPITATAVSPSSYDTYPMSTATAIPAHYSSPPQYPPSSSPH